MLILHCGSATVILDFVELDLQPSIWTILGREWLVRKGRACFRFKLVVSESLVSDFRIAISIYLMADYTCDMVNQ